MTSSPKYFIHTASPFHSLRAWMFWNSKSQKEAERKLCLLLSHFLPTVEVLQINLSTRRGEHQRDRERPREGKPAGLFQGSSFHTVNTCSPTAPTAENKHNCHCSSLIISQMTSPSLFEIASFYGVLAVFILEYCLNFSPNLMDPISWN